MMGLLKIFLVIMSIIVGIGSLIATFIFVVGNIAKLLTKYGIIKERGN